MAMKFEDKMALLAKRNRLNLEWQSLQYGFRRARFACDTWEELSVVSGLVSQMKGVWVDRWSCYEGEFEGYVYTMDAEERKKMKEAQEKKRNRLDDWWTRYNTADPETRCLMASGAIA